jgi:hypothetical protein
MRGIRPEVFTNSIGMKFVRIKPSDRRTGFYEAAIAPRFSRT